MLKPTFAKKRTAVGYHLRHHHHERVASLDHNKVHCPFGIDLIESDLPVVLS
jgi:hypothetical protein